LEYTFILFISFDGKNRNIKTTKLVQASTIACSSSAMWEQHGSTRSTHSSRLARHVERVETWRDEPSGIWAYGCISKCWRYSLFCWRFRHLEQSVSSRHVSTVSRDWSHSRSAAISCPDSLFPTAATLSSALQSSG